MKSECIVCKDYHTFRCPFDRLMDPSRCERWKLDENKEKIYDEMYSSTGFVEKLL
jgi:hypothetical protein